MSALCWPKLALSCPYVGLMGLCWPLLDLSGPYVAPMFAYVSRMLAHVGPKLALSCPYVGLMLTLCSPMLAVEMLSPIAVTETTEVGTG